jgi:hypothetical protein
MESTNGKAGDAGKATEDIRTEAIGIIDGIMRDRMRWRVLRYAVQTAIWCPSCEGVMDVRRAGTLEAAGKISIGCRECLEASIAQIQRRVGMAKWDAALKAGILDVTLGWAPEMLEIAGEVF